MNIFIHENFSIYDNNNNNNKESINLPILTITACSIIMYIWSHVYLMHIIYLIFYIPVRYVRLLGAFYMRLTGNSLDCYNYLEPLYNDYRKVKRMKSDGGIISCYHGDLV